MSGSYDPLTDLESRTHYGRPNFGYIFSQLKKAIESGRYIPGKEKDTTDVGVYYCGPSALAKNLRVDCKNANNSQRIKFHFHKEHF